MRLLMTAFVFGIPENKMRCIALHVGGGFGTKIFLYHEYVLMAALAAKIGRPVKWIETRTENYARDDARPRPHHVPQGRREARRHDHRAEGEDVREPRRRPLDDRAGHPDDAVRADAVRRVPDPEHPPPGARDVHEHRHGRRVSRRRPAGGDLRRERAVDLLAKEPAWIRSRCEELHPAGRVPLRPGHPQGASTTRATTRSRFDRALEIVDYDGFRAEQEKARPRVATRDRLLDLRRDLRCGAVRVDRRRRRGLGRRCGRARTSACTSRARSWSRSARSRRGRGTRRPCPRSSPRSWASRSRT